jgi:TPP-dependent pyruvate/acetoin dehydrogenase alpha subunit
VSIANLTAQDLRDFEQEAAEHFNAGRIRAPIHLSGGCEDQTLEVFKDIREQDWVFTNWRSHYHCLCKGVPRDRLMADILAGKSITLNYPEYRIFSSAIVGGSLPIALGVALSIKRRGGSEKVWIFIGDMTATVGIAHEVFRYAKWHSLPLSMVVENNEKSVMTDTAAVWGRETIQYSADVCYDYILPWPHAGAGVRVVF